MKRSVGMAMALVQLALSVWATLPTVAYWLRPEIFAAACENKDHPCMHCCGKCKLRKATTAALGLDGGPTLREDRAPVSLPADSWLESVRFFGIPSQPMGIARVRCDQPVGCLASPEPPPPKV